MRRGLQKDERPGHNAANISCYAESIRPVGPTDDPPARQTRSSIMSHVDLDLNPTPVPRERIDPGRRRVLIAANPKSGRENRRDLIDRLVCELGRTGYEARVCWDLDEFSAEVREAELNRSLRCVVAAGGDGTAATVVERTSPETSLAILPLGTENLLAKYLGIEANPDRVAQVIDAGNIQVYDAGRANGRIFLLMASVGFDSVVVEHVHRRRRGHINRWTYAWPIVKTIATYSFPRLHIHGCKKVDQASWLFVFNLPKYASGLSIAPWANGQDGLLDVCTFSGGGVWNGLYYWYHLRQGKHPHLSSFCTEAIASLTVEADSPLPYQIDGDAAGYLPLKLESIPNRLRVLTP
jgi:diacylglycerol kinase (ATP)